MKKVCICAILSALFVALEMLSSTLGKIAFLDNYQVPISCFPLVLASVMFGFGWGTLIWMTPTILYTMSVALLYKVFQKSDKTYILSIQFFISSIVLSVLNSIAMYFNNYIYGIPYALLNKLFTVIVSLKLVGAIVFAVIFALIIPPIVKKITKIIKY